jgi:hypothetical protein
MAGHACNNSASHAPVDTSAIRFSDLSRDPPVGDKRLTFFIDFRETREPVMVAVPYVRWIGDLHETRDECRYQSPSSRFPRKAFCRLLFP